MDINWSMYKLFLCLNIQNTHLNIFQSINKIHVFNFFQYTLNQDVLLKKLYYTPYAQNF